MCLSGVAVLKEGDGKKSFVCGQCGRHYIHKDSLTKHLRYECSKEPQFACQFCPYRAKQKGTLKTHMVCKHTMLYKELQNTPL